MLSREIALGVEKNINPPCFIFELLPLCQELFQFLQCFIITFVLRNNSCLGSLDLLIECIY
jgi:hypothetical protein